MSKTTIIIIIYILGLIFGALVLDIWSADTNILKGLLGLFWTALLLIGIFFAEVSSTYPITLELRPTTEGGIPSTKKYIAGTRVIAGPGTGNTISGATKSTSTFYSSPPEHKFTFEQPVYVPANTLIAFGLSPFCFKALA